MRFTGIRSPCSHTNPTSSARSRTDARRPRARASCDRALRLQRRSPDRITLVARVPITDRRSGEILPARSWTDVQGKFRRWRETAPTVGGRKPTLRGSGTDGRGKSTTSRALQNQNLSAPRSSSEGSSRIPQTTVPTKARDRVLLWVLATVAGRAQSPTSAPAWRRPAPSAETVQKTRWPRLALQPSIARRPAPCPA